MLRKKRHVLTATIGITIVVITVAWIVLKRDGKLSPQSPYTTEGKPKSPNSPTEDKSSQNRLRITNPIRETYDKIKNAPGSEAARNTIDTLRKTLISDASDSNIRAIIQFLESGIDTETGFSFHVDKRGFLSGSPTLRVMLLDVLGIVDPEIAADYANDVFRSKDSPDEWAISLRNVAWNNPQSRSIPLLKEKLHEALTHDPWRENPTAGYLHSFDVAVYTQSMDNLPEFAAMLDQDNPKALAHAAFMAMDKMVLVDTRQSLSILLEQPRLLSDHPDTRAGFFSRAAITDSRQKEIVETYLSNTDTTVEEVEVFVALFPNFNLIMSNNLLTENPSYTLGEMAKIDRSSLGQAETWLNDNRFQHLRPQLELLVSRLRDNVASAERGGF